MPNNYIINPVNYMYGQKHRIKFTGKQNKTLNQQLDGINTQNFTNDIDDPIFTGFTFHINMENSALFNGCNKFSDTDASSSIASSIETSLKTKHQTMRNDSSPYPMIETLINKLGDNLIGYDGNQESISSEGFDVNAMEYAFMVDKLSRQVNLTPSGKAGRSYDPNQNISDKYTLQSKNESDVADFIKKTVEEDMTNNNVSSNLFAKLQQRYNLNEDELTNIKDNNPQLAAFFGSYSYEDLEKMYDDYRKKEENRKKIDALVDKEFAPVFEEYEKATNEYNNALTELNNKKNQLKKNQLKKTKTNI